ncbi:MAG: hypothetical protein AB1631_07670 [Acidobacteriota bacterium]
MFFCPECQGAGSLDIASVIDIESDSRSDEIALQVVECAACGFCGIAVYEESRRGSLDSECTDHYGYRMDEADLELLTALISRCPRPRDPSCECRTHLTLNRRNQSGRWNALDDFKTTGYFTMRLEN